MDKKTGALSSARTALSAAWKRPWRKAWGSREDMENYLKRVRLSETNLCHGKQGTSVYDFPLAVNRKSTEKSEKEKRKISIFALAKQPAAGLLNFMF
ncbi:MAG: hypothetical protein P4M13_11165 [Alphaproteobacteria bacterium]|nr:hypothetical protein [Alphaproteobacteria bacterium]